MERTFAIIKPDAVGRNITGKIILKIEETGFTIIAMMNRRLIAKEAECFYAVHRGKPFFESLSAYMSSGHCIAMVLQKNDAIAAWRKLMGATNPAKADPGTIRREFAVDLEKNSVHGSDAPERRHSRAGLFSANWSLRPDRACSRTPGVVDLEIEVTV